MSLTPYGLSAILRRALGVQIDDVFESAFDQLSEAVQDEIFARAKVLEEFGPQLVRPQAHTLTDSKHANMKELRFNCEDGKWRVAFAFDPKRQAVLLVASDKAISSTKSCPCASCVALLGAHRRRLRTL